MEKYIKLAEKFLPEKTLNTLFIRAFGFLKVRMLGYVRPSVLTLTEDEVQIKIPLSRRTRNHLHCMYFGALFVGADTCGGLLGVKIIEMKKVPVSYLFKDAQAEFLKRAEGDTIFTCLEGNKVKAGIEETIRTGERVNVPLYVAATVPEKLGDEVVAKFHLTLSLKVKKKS